MHFLAVETVTIEGSWAVGIGLYFTAVVGALGGFIAKMVGRFLDEAREERKEAREERQARMRTEKEYDELRQGVLDEIRRIKP